MITSKEGLTFEAAYEVAIRWLGQRSLSVQELYRKLHRRGVSQEIQKAVVETLLERRYLDDAHLSTAATRYFMEKRKYGLYYIREKLRLRGLRLDENLAVSYDEYEVAVEAATRHFTDSRKAYREVVARWLHNRGFAFGVIQEVASDYPRSPRGVDN